MTEAPEAPETEPVTVPAGLAAAGSNGVAEIVRLAAAIGCEALLLPQPATTADITALIRELGIRIGADITVTLPPPPAREAPGRRFQLTDRDRQVIEALARYRYLRTGQIQRLVFAPKAGVQMARRRLRFLSAPEFGYLQKVEFASSSNPVKPEGAYYLGPAGIALLGELGLPPPAFPADRPGRVRHRFLEHALALSEFRLNLELALRRLPFLSLQRFTADFEVKEHLQSATAKDRYKLYHAFPGGTRRLVVYPDALVILRHEETGTARLYFVEIDRGTEAAQVLRDKAAAYELYRERGIFRKFGEFPRFRVLFQAPSAKHVRLVRRALAGCKGEELFWVAAAPDINPDSLLTEAVWTDSDGKRRSIFSRAK